MIKTVKISGKCSDMFSLQCNDADGNIIIDYDGYVPSSRGLGGGDYIKMSIDVETGTIIGWNKDEFLNAMTKLSNDKDWER